jgi:cytochrome P450
VPGDWQPKIEKAEAALKKSQDIFNGKLRAELGSQQALIDVAEMKKANGESDEQIGGVLVQLLGSGFVSIRAQLHMLLAELESTPDRLGHAREAASRLTYLQKEAAGEGPWEEMQERVFSVRRAFQSGGGYCGC